MTNLWNKSCVSGDWRTMHMHTQSEPLLVLSVFKNQNKQDDGDDFWWIFGQISSLKLEKDVEDENHYSVLQIDIISNRKYSDLTSIARNEHSTNS